MRRASPTVFIEQGGMACDREHRSERMTFSRSVARLGLSSGDGVSQARDVVHGSIPNERAPLNLPID